MTVDCVGALAIALVAAMMRHQDTAASEVMPPAAYEVLTETVMPHLEENLRYANTRETRCVGREPLATGFPILKHPSLVDCRLTDETRHEETVSYVLACDGGHGTTGTATWVMGSGGLHGTLNVRLGGKNMTFYQRVTATSLGPCAAGHP